MNSALGYTMLSDKPLPRITTYVYWALVVYAAILVTLEDDLVRLLVLMLAALALTVLLGVTRFGEQLAALPDDRPRSAPLQIALLTLLICIGLALVLGVPVPEVRDEFSYLLAADTFSNGRLTNPTHEHWQHFISGHIIHVPSYQSKYPPGQGLVLALGQVATGHAIAGVWLVTALALGLSTWMLMGMLPTRWALFGGFLWIFNFALFDQWGQSYWGGSLAMLSGALLYGGLQRIIDQSSMAGAAALGLGVACLAMTRPYEGLLACIPAIVILTTWLRMEVRQGRASRVARLCLVTAIIIGGGLGWQAYYNQQVTGNAFKPPYLVWLQQSERELQETLVDPVKSSQESRRERLLEGLTPEQQSKMRMLIDTQRDLRKPPEKLKRLYGFYVHPALFLALLAIPFGMSQPWSRFSAVTVSLVLLAVMLNGTAGFPHYLAPVAPLIMLLLVQGLKGLTELRGGLARLAKLVCSFVLAFTFVSFVDQVVQALSPSELNSLKSFAQARARVVDRLGNLPGRHLAIVQYPAVQRWYVEWVNNESDIDSSRIVWAHDLGDRRNRELMEYYRDRQVWLIRPGAPGGSVINSYTPSRDHP